MEFKPQTIYINNAESYKNARESGAFKGFELMTGEENLKELVGRNNYGVLINSFVGFAGTIPTIEAIKAGKRIALANKETMVAAGKIVNELCEKYNAQLLPIDSEHSAILQCLERSIWRRNGALRSYR